MGGDDGRFNGGVTYFPGLVPYRHVRHHRGDGRLSPVFSLALAATSSTNPRWKLRQVSTARMLMKTEHQCARSAHSNVTVTGIRPSFRLEASILNSSTRQTKLSVRQGLSVVGDRASLATPSEQPPRRSRSSRAVSTACIGAHALVQDPINRRDVATGKLLDGVSSPPIQAQGHRFRMYQRRIAVVTHAKSSLVDLDRFVASEGVLAGSHAARRSFVPTEEDWPACAHRPGTRPPRSGLRLGWCQSSRAHR